MFQRKKMRDVKPGDICRLKKHIRTNLLESEDTRLSLIVRTVTSSPRNVLKKEIKAFHSENLEVLRESVFDPNIVVVSPFRKGDESNPYLTSAIVRNNLCFLVSKRTLTL